MNSSLTSTPALPLGGLSTPLVVVLALVAVGAAVALHLLRSPKSREGRIGVAAAQLLGTCLAWWLVVVAAHRWLVFLAGWPAPLEYIFGNLGAEAALVLLCILGGLGTEAILTLYRFERRSATRGVGTTLVTLRLLLLLIVLFWLTQPVRRMHWTTPVDRYIGVLIDSSASMELIDTEPTARERLDLARLFELPLPNRPDEFQDTHRQLAELLRQFNAQLNSVELLGSAGAASRQMQDRITELAALSTEAGRTFDEIDKSLADISGKKLPLDSDGLASVASLQGQLKGLRDGSFSRLRQMAAKSTDSAAPNVVLLRDDLRNVSETLGRLSQIVDALPTQLDEAYWRSLPGVKRAEIEKQTNVARSAIVQKVLSLSGKDHKPFVEELHDGYKLKFYRFASQVVQLPPSTFLPKEKEKEEQAKRENNNSQPEKNPQPGGNPADGTVKDPTSAKPGDKIAAGGAEPKFEEAWRSATDFSAALRQCYQDIPKGSELSGVLVLSDGRHNVDDDPWEPIAHELAAKQVPISTVIIGTRKVPKDAAVAGLDIPDTILLGDKLLIKARLKIDGYRGQEILAKLYRGTEEIGHQAVKVPEDHHHTSIEFSDLPKQAGMLGYRVELLTSTGAPLQESVMVNNSSERQTSVTDDRIKMLVLEARPRWEYRYLKNLFAGRDKTVHLQYMLTNPDWIEGIAHPAPVPVSTSRPYGMFEGTALPENEQEWMKFDVIVLGGVAPTTLDKPTLKLLEKFVNKRGGTLVVIAGQNYMPHAYAGTPLSEMLPVRFEKADGFLGQGPEAGGFNWMLTPEGKENVLMKLSDSPAENADMWRSFPTFRWRHPTTRAKDGANVLAYAENAYQALDGTAGGPAKDAEKKQRDNALVCWQNWGAGKVLMLTCDRSWQMRYQIGDVYHHAFWGQVLRWATDDKLPAGTTLVRLGTDRPRYSVGQPLIIKARLMNDKTDPVVCEDLEAKVYRGDQLLDTVPLTMEQDKPGRYRAEVPKQARLLSMAGKLRIELAGPSVEKLLAQGSEHKAQMEIAVTDSKTTSELIELTADDTIPNKLASMTRPPGRVVTPAQALSLLDAFGERNGVFPYSTDVTLWDWWPVLLLFLLAGSGEWILRKKAGLV